MTKSIALNEYLFVLGRDVNLSILELESYFSCRGISFDIKEKFKNLIVVDLPKLNFNKIISDLGGTVKIAEVFSSDFITSKNKINYGINVYSGDFDTDGLKQYFKTEKIKALRKFASVREIMPSDSLKLDLELIVFKKVFRVVAVYNPKKYKLRDEVRPYYDPLKVTSLRLAKILINLSGVCKRVLVDPFCGLGTVLQEACLMNLKCVGLDKDKETVKKCKKNLAKYDGWRVIHGDACKLNKYFDKINGVATEPYLGPYLKKIPKYSDALKISKELRIMYSCFLESLSKVLIGRAVVIVPVFKTRENKSVNVGFDGFLRKFGFEICSGFPYKYAPKGCKIERMIYVVKLK